MNYKTEVTLLILCMKWVSTWSQNCLQDDCGPDLISEAAADSKWKTSSGEKLVMGNDHVDVRGHYQQRRLVGYHDTNQEKAPPEINGVSVNLLEHPSKKKLKLSETEDASVGACINIENRPWCCTLTMLGWRCCFADSNNVPHTDNGRWARFYVDGHYLYICRRQRGRWLCSAVRQLRYGEKLPNYLYNIYVEIAFENHIAHSEKDASSDKAPRKRNDEATEIDVCLRLLGKMFCCTIRDLGAWTCQFTNELSPQNFYRRKHNTLFDQIITKPPFSITTGLKPPLQFRGNQLPIRSSIQPPAFSSSQIAPLNMSHLFPRAKLGDFSNLLKPVKIKRLSSPLPNPPSLIPSKPNLIFNDDKNLIKKEVPYQGNLNVGYSRDLRSSITAKSPQQAIFNSITNQEISIGERKATATLRRARGALGLAQLSIEQYDNEDESFVRLNGVDPTLQYSIELGPHGGCGSPTHESQPLTLGLIVGNNAVNRVKLSEPLSERLQGKQVTVTSLGQNGASTAYACGYLLVLPTILVPMTSPPPAPPEETSTRSRRRKF